MDSAKKGLYIFGLSTTARAIYTFVKNYNLFDIKGFVVDQKFKNVDTFCETPVFAINENQEFESYNAEEDKLFVAIQWNRVNSDRRHTYEKLKNKNYKFANIISPKSIIHGEIYGDNCWVADGVIIDTNTIIGNNVFVKANAFVGNDCIIRDHSFIGAGSFIAGDCVIGEQSFIGVKATIFDNVNVGKKCIVGACSIINRNINNYNMIKIKKQQSVSEYNSFSIEEKLIHNKNVR